MRQHSGDSDQNNQPGPHDMSEKLISTFCDGFQNVTYHEKKATNYMHRQF